jgi:hypothetical protein
MYLYFHTQVSAITYFFLACFFITNSLAANDYSDNMIFVNGESFVIGSIEEKEGYSNRMFRDNRLYPQK